MKKLLIISYAFPPSMDAGMWRSFKFAKFLPQFGVSVDVLTTKTGNYPVEDPHLLFQLNGEVCIHRVHPIIRKKATDQFRKNLNIGIGDSIKNVSVSFKTKLLFLIRNNFLLPDTAIVWCLMALPKIIALNFKRKYDAIYVSAPPYSVLVLGLWSKMITGKKLIVDYRDPWTQWFNTANKNESKIRKKFGYWIEKKIVNKANYVIGTTPSIVQYLASRIKGESDAPQKFKLIYNGVDLEDYREITPLRFDKKTMLYTGLLNENFYSPRSLFQALAELKQEHGNLLKEYQLLLFGRIGPEVSDMINSFNIEDLVCIKGYVKHRVVVEHLLGADLALLLLNPGVTDYLTISSKLFEYLYMKKEILALISQKSAAGEILTSYSRAEIIEPGNIKKIKNYLLSWLNNKIDRKELTSNDYQIIYKFNRKQQAKELSKLI